MSRFVHLVAPLLAATIAAGNAVAQQPWATLSSFTTPAAQRKVLSSTAGPNGDFYVAYGRSAFSQATASFGDTSTLWVEVVRANATGTIYDIRLGGTGQIAAMAVDAAGNVYLAGLGGQTGLPVTPGAFAQASSGVNTAFACEISATNGAPVFCTYLGTGGMYFQIVAIALDASGNVYIAANRGNATFTATPGALSLGDQQALVFKLNPGGTSLLWAAGFGGSGSGDGVAAMGLGPHGNVWLAGPTNSTDFPITPNAVFPQPNRTWFANLDSSGAKLDYASYGDPSSIGPLMTVDGAGAPYLADRYVTFVLKLSPDGSQVVYRVQAQLSVAAMIVDASGNLTVVGSGQGLSLMRSLTSTCRLGNLSPLPSTATEAWMMRFGPDGTVLQSTYMGVGTEPFQAGAITGGVNGAYVIASSTPGDLGGAPTSIGVVQLGPDVTGASETSIGCWANAGSFETGPLSGGEIFSIYGDGLGPAAGVIAGLVNGQFPISLAGVQVTFDGLPAPALYVQSNQVNAVVPWALASQSITQMCTTWQAKTSCSTVPLGGAAPGLFTVGPPPTGYGAIPVAAAVNQDGTLNSLGNPIHPGEVISVYLAGLGPVFPPPADGVLVQLPVPSLEYTAQAFVCCQPIPPNGLNSAAPAEVKYAGPAPLEIAGLFQINIRVPSFAVNSTAHPLTPLQVKVIAPNGTSWVSQMALIAVAP